MSVGLKSLRNWNAGEVLRCNELYQNYRMAISRGQRGEAEADALDDYFLSDDKRSLKFEAKWSNGDGSQRDVYMWWSNLEDQIKKYGIAGRQAMREINDIKDQGRSLKNEIKRIENLINTLEREKFDAEDKIAVLQKVIKDYLPKFLNLKYELEQKETEFQQWLRRNLNVSKYLN